MVERTATERHAEDGGWSAPGGGMRRSAGPAIVPAERLRYLTLCWAVCVAWAGVCPARTPADEPPQRGAAALIRRLAHRDYAVRTEACRRLCELGVRAIPALQDAVKSSQPEVAIRAGQILRALRSMPFVGVEVSLSLEPTTARWDEPICLVVTFRNPTAYEARLPILPARADPARPIRQAREAAVLLDLADYLQVTDPDGRLLLAHVLDIAAYPLLKTATQARIGEDVPVTVLPPGQTLQVRVAGFNRGWVRYRLLSAGQYHVRFVYQPSWAEFGLAITGRNPGSSTGRATSWRGWRVVSNTAVITITEPAPRLVREGTRPIRGELVVRGGSAQMRLINTYDLDLWVNTHFGGPRGQSARLRWAVRADEAIAYIHHPDREQDLRQVTARDLHRLRPGESLTVGAIALETIRTHESVRRLPGDARLTLMAYYSSLLTFDELYRVLADGGAEGRLSGDVRPMSRPGQPQSEGSDPAISSLLSLPLTR